MKNILIAGSANFISKGNIKTEDLKISIAGSGDIKINDLDVNTTDVNIAGSGDVTLSGKATKSSYSIDGSGDIYTKGLLQNTATCKVSGSGDIEVNAKDYLKGLISGSGSIRYIGQPKKMETNISGSGRIFQIER